MSGGIGIGFFGDGMPRSMNDVYRSSWKHDMDAVERFKSDGTVGITMSAAFNAKYGPKIFNLAYNKHNTLAVLGADTYYMGIRWQEDLSLVNDNTTGVIRGGYRQEPKRAIYSTIEMPYAVNQHDFAMEFGMTQISDIADVVKWEQQVDLESATWLNAMNRQVLARIEDTPIEGIGQFPIGSGSAITSKERVGLESIERIISNANEAQYLPGSTDAAGPFAQPYWLENKLPSSDGSPLAKYRDKDASGFSATADVNYNSFVDCNYNTGTTTGQATMRQLSLPMIDNMFNNVMPYWEDNSTEGACMVTGYDTLTILQALLQPQQRYQGQGDFKMSVNGISSVKGQAGGFQLASYNGVPILPDKMVGRGDKTNPNAGVGRIFLIHQPTLSRGMLKAPVVSVSDDPIVVGSYNRLCNMYELSQVQAKAFRTHGKIIHISGMGS